MRFARLLLIAALAPGAHAEIHVSAQSPGDDASLHAVHQALFASFLPISSLARGSTELAIINSAGEPIWAAHSSSAEFRALLGAFANLRWFGSGCGVERYTAPGSDPSFAALSRADQLHVLTALATCDRNEARRAYMSARDLYVLDTYTSVQEKITGVRLHLRASKEWIASHRPLLPPTRLRYDAQKSEILSDDGPIDYLVVGSGPAGSVLAHELRRGGKRVVLLERGSFLVPGSMETRQTGDLLDTRTTDDGGIILHNGATVGGGSQVNVDLCFAPTLPAVQAKIESWRGDGRIGKDEFTYQQIAAAYEWVKSAIGTRRLSQSEINANNHVLWDGAVRAGLHPKLYHLNTYAPGQSPYPVTDKRSSESQLLIEALQDRHNPLSLIPDADVRRVLFEDRAGEKAAVGVELRMRAPMHDDAAIADPNGFGITPGSSAVIHARTVILSAGALGSPAILLRSGVENDQIGRGVILHPSMPVIGLFDHRIGVLDATQASVYVDDRLLAEGYAFESMSATPAYAALMTPGPAMNSFEAVRSFENLGGFGVMLIDSVSSQNRLMLDEKGEPRIHYDLSEDDKRRFRHGVAEAARMMFLAGAKRVYLPTTEDMLGAGDKLELQPPVLTRIEQVKEVERKLQFVPNRSIVTSAHMQATDKMGADSSESVVGHDFHVWGTTYLYVVDGSVFPTSVGANPMQSIYTFAKIFADQQLRK